MKQKNAQIGEHIEMFYKLMIISLVAVVVFGIYGWRYPLHIDVTHAEAKILSRDVALCLFEDGILNYDTISESERKEILSYCGFGNADLSRFYIEVNIFEGTQTKDKAIATLWQGDSGKGWVRALFETFGVTGLQKKYVPGKITDSYPISFYKDDTQTKATAQIEVIVHNG